MYFIPKHLPTKIIGNNNPDLLLGKTVIKVPSTFSQFYEFYFTVLIANAICFRRRQT